MQWSISSTVCLCPISREYNQALFLIKYVSNYIANQLFTPCVNKYLRWKEKKKKEQNGELCNDSSSDSPSDNISRLGKKIRLCHVTRPVGFLVSLCVF